MDWFRGRHSWRKLVVLIQHLPSSSALVEAQLEDPEYAEWVLAQPEPEGRPSPRLSDWTPEVARLTDLHDRLSEVVAGLVALGGGKPPMVRPSPRPRTAVDRLRAARERARHESLVEEVRQAQQRWEANRAGT